jgi:hypothetical protein
LTLAAFAAQLDGMRVAKRQFSRARGSQRFSTTVVNVDGGIGAHSRATKETLGFCQSLTRGQQVAIPLQRESHEFVDR